MVGKKFRFSLEPVLKLRRHETDDAQEQLAAALRAKQQQEERTLEVLRYLDEILSTRPAGRVGPQMLRQFDVYRQEARAAYRAACDELSRLERAETEARHRLVERKHAQEVLERLRAKEAQSHLETQTSAETEFLDEQAVNGYNRRRRAQAG